jgi:hypothetical protein
MKLPRDMTEQELDTWARTMAACCMVISQTRYANPILVGPLPTNDFITQTMRCGYGDTSEAIKN